ncbi:MAG: SDR family NAD(P)-dependent oxidoreductase [Bryobacteraceae bacterium]|jgi:NAD(P)-dependent dehydrogenase (short-subunit alcohol dehydrogenase family)
MLNRFDGQVVLITGASSGIGAALAREFAREGAHTVLMARRAERIEELARGLTSGARRSLALAGDVTRDGDVEHAVDLARREFGRLDVAVANAGFSVSGLLTDLALEDYRRQMETNVFGVLRTLMATLPALRETRGRIVLTGSMFGMMSIPGATPYCMSKWALGGLAEGLSLELAAYGISVTHIMAGVIETEIYQVDNLGVHSDAPPRRPPPKLLKLPADRAARQIVSAAYHRKRSYILPKHAKLAIFLQRHFPKLVYSAISTATRKALRARMASGHDSDGTANGKPG